MWLTCDDLGNRGVLPVNIFDANDMVIHRAITACDPETGEVESFVLRQDGNITENSEGDLVRRREHYPAPLLWRTISWQEVQKEKRLYWDLNEAVSCG